MENKPDESNLITEKKEINSQDSTTDDVVDKCPVCLHSIDKNSKAYAPICFHSFCFECILEWTKIKHNCPLCKRFLDRIVYDIKSKYEFKEFYLKTSEELYNQHLNNLNQPLYIIGYRAGDNTEANNEENILEANANIENAYSKASFEVLKEPASIEFRSLIYLNSWYVTISQYQSFLNSVQLAGATVDIDEVYSKKNSIAISYTKVNKFRLATPAFFKNNQVALNRLLPFIHRELKALALVSTYKYRLDQNKRYILSEKIINLVKNIDIDSDEFLNEIGPYIRPVRLVMHFIHELKAFAESSCTELIDYDAKAVYYEDEDYKRFISISNDSLSIDSKSLVVSLPVNLNKYRLHYSKKSTNLTTTATSTTSTTIP